MSILPLVGYIELSRGQKALVDWEDLEWLQQWKWCFKQQLDGKGYASRIDTKSGRRVLVLMHRAIFLKHNSEFTDNLEDVDHVNGNRLDNRLCNLRAATRHQNTGNRGANKNNKSGYKGVNFYEAYQCWRAQIMDCGKKRHIGYYATAEEAALAYNIEAQKVFGEFAYQNLVSLNINQVKKLSSSNRCKPFKGVSWHKRIKKWAAYVNKEGKRKHIGYFSTEEEAINAVVKILHN